MALRYEEAVPWGRSFDEYKRMFDLSENDLQLKIIGCGDGPASFNAHMFYKGYKAVSCDPLYQFTAEQIKKRIDDTYDTVLEQTGNNKEKFLWDKIKSVDELGKIRLNAMADFLKDFESGKKEGRYITAQLPALPFPSSSFDLALCSHFLFLYTDNLSYDFHLQSVIEMCRIAKEVRIFPILTYNSITSPYIDPITEYLQNDGHKVFIQKVPYEFQRGGNMMMRIVSRK